MAVENATGTLENDRAGCIHQTVDLVRHLGRRLQHLITRRYQLAGSHAVKSTDRTRTLLRASRAPARALFCTGSPKTRATTSRLELFPFHVISESPSTHIFGEATASPERPPKASGLTQGGPLTFKHLGI